MSLRFLTFAALVSAGTIVLTGAWFGSRPRVSRDSRVSFSPQVVPLDDAVVGKDSTPDQILRKAMERLSRHESGWLSTKIRQSCHDGQNTFTAEGFLQRGPNHCARLELAVHGGVSCGSLVIVSDGERIVHVERCPEAAPVAVIETIPATPQDHKKGDEFLASKSCGGPLAHLRVLREHLKNPKAQTGSLDGEPVIQIEGTVATASVPALSHLKADSVAATVYLDAKTLWPRRIEWHGSGERFSQIEFIDGSVGTELDLDECARVFSYVPTGTEQVTER